LHLLLDLLSLLLDPGLKKINGRINYILYTLVGHDSFTNFRSSNKKYSLTARD
jgi:hypothetical protein